MTTPKERGAPTSPDTSGKPEEPAATIERFIEFTKDPLKGDPSYIDNREWTVRMGFLYGNEELLRVTKDSRYRGIDGIETNFGSALKKGGIPALKIEFVRQVLDTTTRGELTPDLGDTVVLNLGKVLTFK